MTNFWIEISFCRQMTCRQIFYALSWSCASRWFRKLQFWKQPRKQAAVPGRTIWTLQRSGLRHLGQRAQLLPRRLRGVGLKFHWIVFVAVRSSKELHCSARSDSFACVLWRLHLSNASTTLPEQELEDDLEDLAKLGNVKKIRTDHAFSVEVPTGTKWRFNWCTHRGETCDREAPCFHTHTHTHFTHTYCTARSLMKFCSFGQAFVRRHRV